jgi:hypothetical protein
MPRTQTHAPEKGQAKRTGDKGHGATAAAPVQAQKFLGGLDYPVRKQQIIEKAKANGAERQIIAMLERLPDREYEGPAGISRELGKTK